MNHPQICCVPPVLRPTSALSIISLSLSLCVCVCVSVSVCLSGCLCRSLSLSYPPSLSLSLSLPPSLSTPPCATFAPFETGLHTSALEHAIVACICMRVLQLCTHPYHPRRGLYDAGDRSHEPPHVERDAGSSPSSVDWYGLVRNTWDEGEEGVDGGAAAGTAAALPHQSHVIASFCSGRRKGLHVKHQNNHTHAASLRATAVRNRAGGRGGCAISIPAILGGEQKCWTVSIVHGASVRSVEPERRQRGRGCGRVRCSPTVGSPTRTYPT